MVSLRVWRHHLHKADSQEIFIKAAGGTRRCRRLKVPPCLLSTGARRHSWHCRLATRIAPGTVKRSPPSPVNNVRPERTLANGVSTTSVVGGDWSCRFAWCIAFITGSRSASFARADSVRRTNSRRNRAFPLSRRQTPHESCAGNRDRENGVAGSPGPRARRISRRLRPVHRVIWTGSPGKRITTITSLVEATVSPFKDRSILPANKMSQGTD